MNRDVAAALARSAAEINQPGSLQETLEAIVRAARTSIPGVDHVSISVRHRDGRLETLVGTDQLVWDLDSLQYELHEGPCVDSMESAAPVVVVEHARRDPRWPRYLPQAVERGLRAQVGLRLTRRDQAFGGLNLYSTGSDTLGEEAHLTAELFAAQAALALGWAREGEQLNQALASRKTIGQAIGIIMMRYAIDEERAFSFMLRASSTSNTKLRLVAQEVVDDANAMFAPVDAPGDTG